MSSERRGLRSLRSKIALTMIAIVILMLVGIGLILNASTSNMKRTLTESSLQMGSTSADESSRSMTEQTQNRLRQLSADKAEIIDEMFQDFEQSVQIIADMAQLLYDNPRDYSGRSVPLPDAANDGQLSIQALYASETDLTNLNVIKEVRLLGNLQDALLTVNRNFESMASNYFASETGIMIQADCISAKKFDEDGNLLPLDAKMRPWYQGAVETGKAYISPVTRDAHTMRMGIMCGVPVYSGGRLVGVSGAGMYLDDVDLLVQNTDLGPTGDACIVNQDGRVLFSTLTSGPLAADSGATDLRASDNADFTALLEKALSGESGIELITLGGRMHYIAYSPMRTVGWTFLIMMPRDEVETPTRRLITNLDAITARAAGQAEAHITRMWLSLLAALFLMLIVALLLSVFLAKRIVSPISLLTDKVHHIKGDNLDFTWDMNTGDETQQLAVSFASLTERMKTYISDMQAITAEKERIGTELTMAARIQSSMLPSQFPPYPDRHEFDLYASMDPAKEVGGDFYDFFLIDRDHLVLAMADVSGKGVPASLFMMASMILIHNSATADTSPALVLQKVNEQICSRNPEGMFVSVWLGILEISTGRLTAANAGHEYPAIRKPDGNFEFLKDKHGFVIGAMEGMKYRDYTLQLEPGSDLFVYTDGLPEAMNASGELFGMDRILTALNRQPGVRPETLLANISRAVEAFVGDAEQFDDLTMLAFRYNGG